MNNALFSRLQIGPVEAPNRIAVSPMCQYSADDGKANAWHLAHWMQLGMSGAGVVMLEATAVERRGRITLGCLGLYDDACEDALATMIRPAMRSAMPGTVWGIQIGHAGRKASAQVPWRGGRALSEPEDAWPTFSASAIPFADGWPVPTALTEQDLERITQAFVATALRAAKLGFGLVELHGAHGYLIHQFLSPVSNKRTDRFGGSAENRARFPLMVARAVKAALPPNVALGMRITGSDWVAGAITPEEAGDFAAELKTIGLDYVCVSSGGITLGIPIAVGPGYQVPFAEAIRKRSGLVTRAVGIIVEPRQADAIIAEGKADSVALARAFLDNPRWVWHAAEAFGVDLPYPVQYERVKKAVWPGAAIARA